MKCLSAILATLALLSAGCLPAAPASDRHVILVSLDGLGHFYMDDVKAQLPTLRKLAAEGANARRMVASFPTVTWPNHTTMVTGVTPAKHGVISNGIFDRKEQKDIMYLCDPVVDKADLVTSPTIYDVAHAAGLKTAGVCWPATRNVKTLDWMVPDMIDQEQFDRFTTPALAHECLAVGIPLAKQGEWCKNRNGGQPLRDFMYAQIGRHIMEKHQPNLLMLHLVGADSYQHSTGRQSPEAYCGVNDCDRHLAALVESVRNAGLLEKTTFIVTADHGFRTFTKQIQPNVLFRKEGLLTAIGGKVTSRRIWCLNEGGSAFIYVLDDANRESIIADIKPKLAALEGVDWVSGTEEFAALGFPTPDRDARAPDILLSAKDGYAFSEVAGGEDTIFSMESPRGAHGYDPALEDMKAIFIAWGAGIKPGVQMDQISNLDIAPTIAHLLGVEMKTAEGRVLREILK